MITKLQSVDLERLSIEEETRGNTYVSLEVENRIDSVGEIGDSSIRWGEEMRLEGGEYRGRELKLRGF